MLNVKTPEEVFRLIEEAFQPLEKVNAVSLDFALGEVLAEDITAEEYVPDFDRSTVDGYALRAADTFGCSDSLPAILNLAGEVKMGEGTEIAVPRGACVYVPTGGKLPADCDCAVMIEYTEDYGDGTVGVFKAAAPGQNLIFRGDDARPGKLLLRAGHVLRPRDVGALAAIGKTEISVRSPLRVGLLSTGDELVPAEQKPGPGQMRDVNRPMLRVLLRSVGAIPVDFGIVKDDEALLREKTALALDRCDAVILSGGSSAGVKDAACRVIESLGELLFHGIAVKPGKPTILGKAGNKPLIGLPGHPVAAYYMARFFVLPLLSRLGGRTLQRTSVEATLSESLNANHGRMQITPCSLETEGDGLVAVPLRTKSGLITQLTQADGYLIVERDCEGLAQGSKVRVWRD